MRIALEAELQQPALAIPATCGPNSMRPSTGTSWSARRWGRAAAARTSITGLAQQQNYTRIAIEAGELLERIKGVVDTTYCWPNSTYIAEPPFFFTFTMKKEATKAIYTGARGLKILEPVPDAALRPQSDAQLVITLAKGSRTALTVLLRIDTPIEVDHYRAGDILPFVLSHSLQDDRV